jgi:hypothetical protein
MVPLAMQLKGRAGGRALGLLFACALAVGLLTACGISVGSGEQGTEVFKRLTISGDFRLTGRLMGRLEYENPYTVELWVQCDLIDPTPGETPAPLVTATAEAPPGATPTSAPVPRPSPTTEGFVAIMVVDRLPANPDGGLANRVTPVPGVLEFDIPPPTLPGEYRVRCYTPDDRNNQIAQRFTVGPELAPS